MFLIIWTVRKIKNNYENRSQLVSKLLINIGMTSLCSRHIVITDQCWRRNVIMPTDRSTASRTVHTSKQ